mmetsp:Transcript_24272/g.59422  ORF Transcript_24272/g.59422 Transcript_24272/m.59422 type:complete len:83 (-) Transcript_24272:1183-1431(-)
MLNSSFRLSIRKEDESTDLSLDIVEPLPVLTLNTPISLECVWAPLLSSASNGESSKETRRSCRLALLPVNPRLYKRQHHCHG